MRIYNPQREAETAWILENPINRVDIEAAVFQPDNMTYLSGEYEASIHDGEAKGETLLRIGVECLEVETCDRRVVEDTLVSRLLASKPGLAREYSDGNLRILLNVAAPGDLEIFRLKGRPRRLVDRRGSK